MKYPIVLKFPESEVELSYEYETTDPMIDSRNAFQITTFDGSGKKVCLIFQRNIDKGEKKFMFEEIISIKPILP